MELGRTALTAAFLESPNTSFHFGRTSTLANSLTKTEKIASATRE
jgi:hypothetical protein